MINALNIILNTNAFKYTQCFKIGKSYHKLSRKKVNISASKSFATDLHRVLSGLNAWTSGEILASAV